MRGNLLKIVAALLVIWLVVAVIGAVVRGLIWLTVAAAVLFVATAAWGYLKHRSSGRSAP
ncbi:DUF7554 family protein [Pseudonocardia humida]|uniref:Secreted protein n=1 Tax=Pseudonocardia humida TaxID=2800819 RepID=A0ABT1A8G3_9PSEU|nr:hypothetical protein [Pseudonocardia humida]MCO1658984.1 hypothetical protein [Pseudonocardia humida]